MVILNITADHIERHKSLKNYVNAKFKLLKSQIRGSFAYVKKEDELITKKLNKNKYSSKISSFRKFQPTCKRSQLQTSSMDCSKIRQADKKTFT